MKNETPGIIGRHVPLALVAAVLLQGATVVWWASAKERDLFFMEQRVSVIEAAQTQQSQTQSQILERLARIEERLNAHLAVLEKIERKLGAARR